MSDINIVPSVDTSEIDAAIAKLEAALEKTGQLTGQTSSTSDVYTIPNSEMEQATAKQNADFFTIPNSEMDDLTSKAETAKQTADAVLSKGDEIKGLDGAASRVIRMIPGLREAQRIQRSIGLLSEGSLMGGLGLLMVAYSIYRQISAYLEEQKQQQAEYQKAIMDIRGFTTSAQFKTWEDNQNRVSRNYLTKPPI